MRVLPVADDGALLQRLQTWLRDSGHTVLPGAACNALVRECVRLAPGVVLKLAFIHDRIHRSGDSGEAEKGALRAVAAGLKRAVGSPDAN